MALSTKYEVSHKSLLRDARPLTARMSDWFQQPAHSFIIFFLLGMGFHFFAELMQWADLVTIFGLLYFWWLKTRDKSLAFKMPLGAKFKDKNSKDNKPEGILYLGNTDPDREEVWFSNGDARTHILYLGTTGSGKTVGLRGMACNALAWGSGFVYIDGKADTDLWSALSSLARRFGRDDDLLVLNYMTGNSDRKAPSNTMNPFSSGSASYLTQMLVSLMPDAEGDNAMWKERAVSLIGSLMPVLTWKRDNLDIPMSVGIIRQNLTLQSIIKLSREESIPEYYRQGLKGYLDTLPGYVDAAFDDEGRDKPMGPDQPMMDTTTAKTQHGYLSMQFTRSLQSLADDYGYIFDSQAADVDMLDVVLNRRMLVVLIPALEKSADEAANLGKIVSTTIKGMMGGSLGSAIEGDRATVIDNKPTNSATPFMTIFDEVGYYAASGMAVMAAQARSLGFSMIFSAQDLPALEKRVKEEARSITANCNIKIFGKLEDPTQTKEFFEKTVGSSFTAEVSGFAAEATSMSRTYMDNMQAGIQTRGRSNYDSVRSFKEGQAVVAFGERVVDVRFFFADPGHAKAMRVTRYVALPQVDDAVLKHSAAITKLRDFMVQKGWAASKADVSLPPSPEIKTISNTIVTLKENKIDPIDFGTISMVAVYGLSHSLEELSAPPPSPPQASDAKTGGAIVSEVPTPADVNEIPTGLSWHSFVEQAESKVELDSGTQDVLQEAAEKARESIFKSDDRKNSVLEDNDTQNEVAKSEVNPEETDVDTKQNSSEETSV